MDNFLNGSTDDQNGIGNLRSADKLVAAFNKLKTARETMDRQWKVNLSFYKGYQWVFWNKDTNRIESLPTAEGDKPRYRIRLTSNQVIGGSNRLLAMLTKTKPTVYATPGNTDASSLKAAKLAEKLYEYWWDYFQLTEKLYEALMWSIVAGQGYWRITWDKNAAEKTQFVVDPNNNIITDDSLKQIYLSEANKMGLPEEMIYKFIALGDIKIDVLSPFEVYMDPTPSVAGEARYAVCKRAMPLEHIKAEFGITVPADSIPETFEAVNTYRTSGKVDNQTKVVYYGYYLPSMELPKGRYVIWIEGPNKILHDEDWPYPTHDLPIVKFPGLRIPGQVYDSSIVEHVIPLQKDFNKTLSSIVEHKNLTLKPQWMAPANSLRVKLTNEPGAVFPFNGQIPPTRIEIPSIPPHIFEHLHYLKKQIDEMFFQVEVNQGQVPPNVETGIAIDLLQETATDALAPMVKSMEDALCIAGKLMLALAKEYYIEERIVNIKGSTGKSQVKAFKGSDIDSSSNITIETGSSLPRSRAARQARIMQLVQTGIIDMRKAYKFFDSADLRSIGANFEADEAKAAREYDALLAGDPINPITMREAIKAVQTPDPSTGVPMNPDTGQPFTSQQEVEVYVHSQSLKPSISEDYDTHLEIHGLQIKDISFDLLPPDMQQDLMDHYGNTMDAMWQLRIRRNTGQMKGTYQIKGTAGPTISSAILNHLGIPEATPDASREEPLNTWVSDNLDNSNPSDSGSGNIQSQDDRDMAAMQQMQQLQDMDNSHTGKQHSAEIAQIQKLLDMQHQIARHNKDMEIKDQQLLNMKQKADNGSSAPSS